MIISEEKIIAKLREWVDALEKKGDADKPIAASGYPVVYITPRSILKDVVDGTAEGKRFIENWVELALDHILNAPL